MSSLRQASPQGPGPRGGLFSRLLSRWTGAVPSNSDGVRFGGSCGYRDSAYAGASRTRKQLHNWQPVRAPADAELLPEQGMLVARSRDLDRNNGVAAGAFQTLQDNIVGIGLRLSCKPDFQSLGRDINWSEDWSRQVESLWKTWANTTACDVTGRITFAGMTQLVLRSLLQNGEALALPLWMERPETPFRTCLQLVDTDRLSNPNFQPDSLTMRGGIEMDLYGKPLAYNIQKRVPGPLWIYSSLGLGTMEWERVPAETDFARRRVLHIYQQDRVDQSRGKPLLTPVIEQFRQLDSYQRTELQSAIVNALVAGVIETPMDPASINEMMGGCGPGSAEQYLDKKNEYHIQAEGGTFFPLYPGDKLTPFIPTRPAVQFAAFSEFVLRQIGAAMGLPYELVLKDFSKTNYSSARAALLEAWRGFVSRRTWLATYWAQPVYRLWLEEVVNAGMIEAADFYDNLPFYLQTAWIGPGRGYIDPIKEAQAAQIRMDTMTSTLEVECAEQGLDWNDVLLQRALEVKRMKQLGLTPPITPATPKGEQLAPDTADEPAGDQPAPGAPKKKEAA